MKWFTIVFFPLGVFIPRASSFACCSTAGGNYKTCSAIISFVHFSLRKRKVQCCSSASPNLLLSRKKAVAFTCKTVLEFQFHKSNHFRTVQLSVDLFSHALYCGQHCTIHFMCWLRSRWFRPVLWSNNYRSLCILMNRVIHLRLVCRVPRAAREGGRHLCRLPSCFAG